ncbi:MAG: hypothetical protein R2804_15310 [Cyclobacteriaceae bacterium]
MTNYHLETIGLVNLLIYTDNPRFETVANQRDAIAQMIDDQGEKLFNLGKHIVEMGTLNPSELVIVSPNQFEKKKFDILEGNRRITALKLLETPNIIGDTHKALRTKFRKLNETFKKKPIKKVNCIVFEKAEDAYEWIKLRHTGENDGVGIVKWDAQQAGRFEERIDGKSPIAIQVLDFISKNSKDSVVQKQVKKIPSSSLTRIIGDKDIREVLGLRIDGGQLSSIYDKKEVAKGLTKVARDLLSKTFSVKDIYTKDDRLAYIEKLKGHLPNKEKTVKPWNLSKDIKVSVKDEKKKKLNPLSEERGSIIPKNFIIAIHDAKPNKIYRELKYLDVNSFENGGAVLLRVFVELSVDKFISSKKIQGIKRMTPLKEKTIKVIEFMQSSGIATKQDLKGISNAVSNDHDVLSIDTFNAYVHNGTFSPVAKELIISWDRIQKFIEKIWDNISE